MMKMFGRNITKSIALLVSLILTGSVLAACEDDPILQPNQGTSSSGGSYGRIDIAPRDSARADKPVAPSIRSTPETNPELF